MKFKLSETGILSPATRAFVLREKAITDLIGNEHPYLSIENAIKGKADFESDKRNILADSILSQYQTVFGHSENDAKVRNNIELLRQNNTFTVCTGQQLHLFLGPVFVLSKIIAVINLAENSNLTFPDKKFIPVFWLASEDHDIDEIRDNTIFKHNYRWETSEEGACGRFSVEDVSGLLRELKANSNLGIHAEELLHGIEDIYNQSKSLAEATIKLVHKLFGAYGIVCIDADRAELKSGFLTAIKKDILESQNIGPYKEFSDKMEAAGLSTQLGGRDINFFYLSDGIRKRIIREENGFRVLDTEMRFSASELSDTIDKHPEMFSPNALMRPLYQECILPNVAYLGGNAEVNYWLQISILFKINNINPPNLQLRPSMWIIPVKIEKWLEKHNLNPVKLLINEKDLQLLDFITEDKAVLQHETDLFIKLRKQIQDIVAQHNTPILQELVNSGKAYEKSLKSAERAVAEALKIRFTKEYEKLEDIYHTYFNIKHLQDRKTHTLELLIKYGTVVNTIKTTITDTDGTGYIIPI